MRMRWRIAASVATAGIVFLMLMASRPDSNVSQALTPSGGEVRLNVLYVIGACLLMGIATFAMTTRARARPGTAKFAADRQASRAAPDATVDRTQESADS